ncbi:Thioredoxin-like protein [Venustampulla echinocandica]|uniref:Thioredoxin-like protein n=1 Tax=Venustampulla echinocandica TaxID=2656787 RepID=A0A370TRS4_9HELO|nr:Thioredoxin-like protein [Venustampulla echinocandica]RDL38236.1 Thioredoxin-like protein [Venustampulla echinocandica]
MSTLIEIKSEDDWSNHTSAIPPTALQIISFHAPWAAPCAQMRTVLETLASSYPITEPLSTSWVSMNAEELMDISDNFDVTAVPYLVLTRNNEILETVSGSDATKVREAIEKYAKASAGIPNGNRSSAAATTGGNVATNSSTNTPAVADPATAPQHSTGDVKEDKEELHKRLTTLVKAAPVMLFMKGTPSAPQCGFSKQLVALLRENSVKYGFFNILADDDVRQGLKEFSDWPTFPQLYVDGELVGGLDIVKEELSNEPDFLKAYSVSKSTAV